MEAYRFDPEAVRDRLVGLIRETAASQDFTRVVVGVSGGKDSTVTAALCARALGKENVYGVMLPDGEQKDISDSRAVCGALGIRQRTVPLRQLQGQQQDHRGLRLGIAYNWSNYFIGIQAQYNNFHYKTDHCKINIFDAYARLSLGVRL